MIWFAGECPCPLPFRLTVVLLTSFLVVSHAERVFVYEGLANGTTPAVANYANVAPFFLNETFPENWYRRGDPFTLPAAFEEAGAMFLSNPREIGGNEGLNNFIPLGFDLTSQTPAQIGCFILENILDLAPNQIQPTIVNNLDLFTGFVKGVCLYSCSICFLLPPLNILILEGTPFISHNG